MGQEPNEQNRKEIAGRNGGTLYAGGPGRPKGSLSLKTILRNILEENDQKESKALMAAIVKNAKAGNAQLAKMAYEIIEGPMPTKSEVEIVAQMTDEQLLEMARKIALRDSLNAGTGGDGGTPEEGSAP